MKSRALTIIVGLVITLKLLAVPVPQKKYSKIRTKQWECFQPLVLPPDSSEKSADALQFSNYTGTTFSNTLTDSWNGAWVDYNNDGWDDLFIGSKNAVDDNLLYKNNGNGTFTKITNGTLVNFKAHTASSTWADINNDGRLDVFVVNNTQDRSRILLNSCNGNFIELVNSGIDIQPEYFMGASWLDYDNDGYVDLLVTNFFSTRFHQLYHNNKNNTFTLVTNTPITLESERSMAPICADYNNDGLMDVFIPNGDNRPNSLFRNTGNGQFVKVTTGAIATDAFNSVGAAWGDYNNDGFMDLYVANASNQNDNLYKNNGDGTFTAITNSPIVSDSGHTHGANWMDIDNDGDLDLYATNDVGVKFLYINDGQGNFTRKTDELITADFGLSYGQAWADYNKDGFLDVMVFTHSNQPNYLFKNNGNGNKFISIKLQGTNSNRSAIGARIRVKAKGKWQTRQVNAQSGFGSQNSLRQHFGLANANKVDSIEVRWPSGYVQYLRKVNVNKFITITEDQSALVTGVAFNDVNGNCQKESNESVIANATFKVTGSGITVVTNNNGVYQVRLAPGPHYFNYQNGDNYWYQTCTAGYVAGNCNQGTQTVNIPLRASANGYDLTVTYGSTAWRRGFKNQAAIQCQNTGTTNAYNVTVSVTYPANVKVVSSAKPYVCNANTYTWIIDTLKAGKRLYIQVADSVTLNAVVGQRLPITAYISAPGVDLRLSNNNFTDTIDIVGAIDPNDILVSPRGDGDDAFIAKNQMLTYTIRFQNVGTYAAQQVVIKNKLSQYLDVSTFRIIGASHEYEYEIDEEGNLVVTFNDINLPDSATSQLESNGFFQYSILPAENVSGGEKIENFADITFDYEDPITTNTVVNTIKYYSYNKVFNLLVYPNPSSDNTSVSFDKDFYMFGNSPVIKQLNIYNTSGVRVYSQIGNMYSIQEINISNLQKGYYIIEAIDKDNNEHVGKLTVQ